jgi:hypothetical protein
VSCCKTLTDINVDELGPVDYLVVALPAEEANFSGKMASELKRDADDSVTGARTGETGARTAVAVRGSCTGRFMRARRLKPLAALPLPRRMRAAGSVPS